MKIPFLRKLITDKAETAPVVAATACRAIEYRRRVVPSLQTARPPREERLSRRNFDVSKAAYDT
jgi:hypothetical protein